MTLLSWIAENKNWIFEGIGVTAIGFLFFIIKKIFWKDKTLIKQIQQSGDNSVNIQVGENLDINKSSITRIKKK